MEPSVLRRTILFNADPLYPVKAHPTTTFPSLWIASAETEPLNHDPIKNQVSISPPLFIRAILFDPDPLYAVKVPPTTIFPSLWIANALTIPLHQAQTVKFVSNVPLVLRRIILLIEVPLYVLKFPPTTIFPSLWSASALIALLNQAQIVNVVSNEPSVLRRVIYFWFTQL